jgi:anti-anti-sigma factor
MQINRQTDQSITVLEPLGDMGLYNLGELRAMLLQLRESGQTKVIIDMGKVPGIDSITIGFLLQETTLFAEAGGALKIAKISASVRKSLNITETLSQMSVYDDVETAKATFKSA